MATIKERKPGINHPIRCKKCGHRVGFVKIKPRLKWRTIKYAIVLALGLEIVANIIVYLLFERL